MSRAGSQAAQLIKIVCDLGHDRFGNSLSIRTADLAAKSGVAASSINAMLAGAVAKGEICVCKITPAGGRPVNEYRKGGGVPAPAFVPLKIKRAGVALSTASQAARPVLSSKPQPAVGCNPGSVRSEPSSAGEHAVAAAKQTPGPTSNGLNAAPAKTEAPAGDVFNITIDDAGVLVIGTDEGVIELQPEQCKRLGHFMVGSERIWNAF